MCETAGFCYYSDSSLAQLIFPSLSPTPYACVVHMSLGKMPRLGGQCLFYSQAHLLPAACQTLQLLAPGLNDYLPSDPKPTFSFHEKKNPFSFTLSLSLSFSIPHFSPPFHPFSCSLFLLSFPSFFLVGFCSHFTKIKTKTSFECFLTETYRQD